MLTSSKPTDNLQDLVRRQAQLIEQQSAQIALLTEQLAWLKRQRLPFFAAKLGSRLRGGVRFPLQPYLAGCVYLGLGAAALTGLRKP